MSRIVNIKLHRGFGHPKYNTEGYYYSQDVMMRDDGVIVSKPTACEMGVIGTGSSITDIFCCNYDDIFAISNGKFYYSTDRGNTGTWQECTGSGLTFTPTYGTWALMGPHIAYQDAISGKPLLFTMGSPPTYAYISPTTFGSNFGGGVIHCQNRLHIWGNAGGSKVFYSAVGDPTSFSTGDYYQVGGGYDAIIRMANMGANLIVIKHNSIWGRSANHSEFISSQFGKIIDSIAVAGDERGVCTGNGAIYLMCADGPKRLSEAGLQPLLTRGFRTAWHDWGIPYGTVKLFYWIQKNMLFVMDSNGNMYNYDENNGVWNLWKFTANPVLCASNDPTYGYFVMGRQGTDTPYKILTGFYGKGGWIESYWEDCGSPFTLKRAKKIYILGNHIDQVVIYGRKSICNNSGGVIQQFDSLDVSEYTLPVSGKKQFYEMKISISGKSDLEMRIKRVAVEVEELVTRNKIAR